MINYLVWGHVGGSGYWGLSLSAVKLAGAGRGPNQMPRHVLSNLDTSLKTLNYLPSLKNVELWFLKKCRLLALLWPLEDLARCIVHLPIGSYWLEDLHTGCPLFLGGIQTPVALGVPHSLDYFSYSWQPCLLLAWVAFVDRGLYVHYYLPSFPHLHKRLPNGSHLMGS